MSEHTKDYIDKVISIGDYSHVLFFEVLGIPGRIANSPIEAYGIIQEELSEKGHKLILISKKYSDEFPEDISDINLSGDKIVFELPENGEDEKTGIADKIMSILGVSNNEY